MCCVPEGTVSACEDQGGFCIGWAPVCPETHYTAWEYPCFYGQCCMPMEDGPCMQSGGQCTAPGSDCPEGFYPLDTSDPIWTPTGCPWEREQCCMPVENPCVGLGGRGYAFDQDVCCPGLMPAALTRVTPTGDCDVEDFLDAAHGGRAPRRDCDLRVHRHRGLNAPVPPPG